MSQESILIDALTMIRDKPQGFAREMAKEALVKYAKANPAPKKRKPRTPRKAK